MGVTCEVPPLDRLGMGKGADAIPTLGQKWTGIEIPEMNDER
jgi:hypothetical protein